MMDLNTTLSQQQDISTKEEPEITHNIFSEVHYDDLPSKKRNIIGLLINSIVAIFLVLSMLGALLTMAVFVIVEKSIDTDNATRCILFASYDIYQTPPFKFGDALICQYVQWSLVAVSVFCFIYTCKSCFHGFCNLSMKAPAFTCIALIDLVVVVLCVFICMSIGVIVRLGHDQTCQAVYDVYPESIKSQITNCSGRAIMKNGVEVSFSNNLVVTEMTAWATTILLLLLTLVYVILSIGFFIKCCRSKSSSPGDYREEFSPFGPPKITSNEDDDEPLLNPLGDEWSSETNTETYPPYNIGTPVSGSDDQSPW